MPDAAPTITYDDFCKVDIRVGTVLKAEAFPEARKPAYKLEIDFGPEIGIRRSSAQITQVYQTEELVGKQVLGVVNFPEKRIGPFLSQTLTLGIDNELGAVVLIAPTHPVPNGMRLY